MCTYIECKDGHIGHFTPVVTVDSTHVFSLLHCI